MTAVFGGIAIASGVDTLNLHDEFVARPSVGLEENGRSAQVRTNVLIGVTGGLAAATAALGIFAVQWSDDAKAAPRDATQRYPTVTIRWQGDGGMVGVTQGF